MNERIFLGVGVHHVAVELEASLCDLEVVLVLQQVFVHLVLRGKLVAGGLRSATSVNCLSQTFNILDFISIGLYFLHTCKLFNSIF